MFFVKLFISCLFRKDGIKVKILFKVKAVTSFGKVFRGFCFSYRAYAVLDFDLTQDNILV